MGEDDNSKLNAAIFFRAPVGREANAHGRNGKES